jgi:hypothetical protein
VLKIQEYYGLPYTRAVNDPIISYLKRFTDLYRKVLLRAVIKTLERRWGQLPDVATLVKLEAQCNDRVRQYVSGQEVERLRAEEAEIPPEEREEMKAKWKEVVEMLSRKRL